ncbi:MAG: hypothetical protein WC211_01470 [Dehalococcoidia bacterium]
MPGEVYEWVHGRHPGAQFAVVKVSALTVEIRPLGALSVSGKREKRHQVRKAFVEASARLVR